jgi:hypothetical protein
MNAGGPNCTQGCSRTRCGTWAGNTNVRVAKAIFCRQRGLTTLACAAAAEGPGANGLFLEWLKDLELVKKAVAESA